MNGTESLILTSLIKEMFPDVGKIMQMKRDKPGIWSIHITLNTGVKWALSTVGEVGSFIEGQVVEYVKRNLSE